MAVFALAIVAESAGLLQKAGAKARRDFGVEIQIHESFLRSDLIWKSAGGETL
jgi:hypothetical protein